MLLAMTASVALVVSTILVLYETLRLTSEHLSELPVPPRVRILAVVLMTFVGHTVAVWIYAGAYWLLVLRLGIGTFAGEGKVEALCTALEAEKAAAEASKRPAVPQ